MHANSTPKSILIDTSSRLNSLPREVARLWTEMYLGMMKLKTNNENRSTPKEICSKTEVLVRFPTLPNRQTGVFVILVIRHIVIMFLGPGSYSYILSHEYTMGGNQTIQKHTQQFSWPPPAPISISADKKRRSMHHTLRVHHHQKGKATEDKAKLFLHVRFVDFVWGGNWGWTFLLLFSWQGKEVWALQRYLRGYGYATS